MINLVFEDVENLRNCYDLSEKLSAEGMYRITVSSYANNLKMMQVQQAAIKFEQDKSVKFDNISTKINILSSKDTVEGKYIIPLGVNQSPDIWMCDFYEQVEYDFKNIFDKLSKRYLSDLQSGKAFLMVDNTLEGYHSQDIFDYLHQSATARFISPKQIIYVTGNLNIEDNLEKWCLFNKGKVPIQVIPYAHFEYDIGKKLYEDARHKTGILPTTHNHETYKDSLGPDGVKLFNFLNKKPRIHRMWLYIALSKWNLLDKGIISMNPIPNGELNLDFNIMPEEDVIEGNKTLPLYAYDDNTNDKEFKYYMYNFNQRAALESWITIVSETHFEDATGTCFLSEKTFKAIACQTPFMILGNKNSLKRLHDMGYKTFHHIIDETYDTLDSIHRINAMIDEIRRWEGNPDRKKHMFWLRPILEYNVEVLQFNTLFKPPNKFFKLVELLK